MPPKKSLARLDAVEHELTVLSRQYRFWREGLPREGRGTARDETRQTLLVLSAVLDILKASLPAYNYIPF